MTGFADDPKRRPAFATAFDLAESQGWLEPWDSALGFSARGDGMGPANPHDGERAFSDQGGVRGSGR